MSYGAKTGAIVGSVLTTLLTIGFVGATNQPTSKSTNQNNVNVSPTITTEEVIEKKDIPFETVKQKTSSLPEGTTEVDQQGKNGERTIIYTVTYSDGTEVERTIKSDKISKQPIDKIILVGTYVAPKPKTTSSSCDSNYQGGCVPIVSYDLNCPDIGFRVYVIGYDKHGFDRDGDGVGCESY